MLRRVALLTLFSTSVWANQTLLLDVHYTHTSDNSARNRPFGAGDSLKGSHAYFAPAASQPGNFQSPIDYRHGKFAVVLDVISKPSSQRLLWGGCGVQGNATCFGYLSFTSTGRYVLTQDVSSFWQVDAIDWSRSFNSFPSIFRDENEKKLDLGEGFLHEPDYSAYYPMELRLRLFAVSAGATFVLPVDPVDAGPADAGGYDAGGVDAGGIDAGARDAGHASDAGAADAGPLTSDAGVEPQLDAGAQAADAGPNDAGTLVVKIVPDTEVEGGCASAPGGLLLGLVAWWARRRQPRSR